MSVTIDDYIRSIKEEIITARQNDVKGFLVKPSPAQLRNLCLLLFDEGLNSNDKVIFESFFRATKEDDLRKKIENIDIDKFRPIKNLLEGSIGNPTTINLELTAVLISLKKRPYKNFSKGLEPEKRLEVLDKETSSQTFDEKSITIVPKKNNFKKRLYGGIGLVAISVFGIISNNYNSKKELQCMQWQIDHYEKVDCEMKNALGAMSISQVEVMDESVIDLKKIEVSPETTFFIKNKAVIYYCKVNDSILEYYNAPGFHPVLEKPLKPITKYIIKKYIK
jgi:hypothetical protein